MNDREVLQFASRWARLALAGVCREFPNKLDHVMGDQGDVRAPRDLHPAFYGCYDWHSAVHAHWLLARVLGRWGGPGGLPESAEAERVLDLHLTTQNIAAEIEYLRRPLARAFERTYGWAWALRLHEELARAGEARGAATSDHLAGRFRAWARAMRPLAEVIAAKYEEYLPRLTYPNRTGVHANTAFGLLLAWGWADQEGRESFRRQIESTARRFFEHDEDYPVQLEPSASDFLSPCLMESALMSRIMGSEDFAEWFGCLLIDAEHGEPANLFMPVEVSDRHDPQIVHLDGLNLSRAWCMRTIAGVLRVEAERDPWAGRAARQLAASADRHEAASLPHVASGAYEGEHWLGTFALLAGEGA